MKIICADIWHSLGAGQPKAFLIGSGSPWAAARMLSSAFCISGLTGLSHPVHLLGTDQVLHKPSSPCVGFPWALYIQMEAEFFPRKMSPTLTPPGSEDPVPPWPRCKGSAVLPSAETPFITCHGADPPLREPVPASPLCHLPSSGGRTWGQASIPPDTLASGVRCCWGRCTRQKMASPQQKVLPSPVPLKRLEAAAGPGCSTALLPAYEAPLNCSRGC